MKTKYIISLSLIILFLFTHCQKPKIEYYENGNIKKQTFGENIFFNNIQKDVFKSDKFKSIYSRLNKLSLDSVAVSYYEKFNSIEQLDFFYETKHNRFIFYSNGNLKMEGMLKDDIPTSKWNFYTKDEKLELIRDIKLINGKPYINQELYYSEKQDTIYEVSTFYELKYDKDTIGINEEFKAIVNLPIPYFKKRHSNILVCVADSKSNDFNEDFSNEEEINKNCFYDFETTKVNKKWVEGVNYNHSAAFSKTFHTPGSKFVKGIIIEYFKNNKDSINQLNKKYFSIPVYVLPDKKVK